MRVFSQINNCQRKQNNNKKKTKQKKPDKTKRGAPLLDLAKSIYYRLVVLVNASRLSRVFQKYLKI